MKMNKKNWVLALGLCYGAAFAQQVQQVAVPTMPEMSEENQKQVNQVNQFNIEGILKDNIESQVKNRLELEKAQNDKNQSNNVKESVNANGNGNNNENKSNLNKNKNEDMLPPAPPKLPKVMVDESPVMDIKFFKEHSDNVSLSKIEKESLRIAEQWQSNDKALVKPVAGQNGAVKFVYGEHQPSIICAVSQVCDIALQVGEQINGFYLGDSVRWIIEPAIMGSGDDEIQHLIIKPSDSGLKTSLVVMTNRRVYHMQLKSHRTKYMPFVSFSYPEDNLIKFNALSVRNHQQNVLREKQKRFTRAMEKSYSNNLKFNYVLEGNMPWKPVRVFNDGVKTYIDMPESMAQTEAPTLLLLRKEGSFFKDDETVIVNYRVQGNRYIVDSVFDKAILIAGVGRGQDRVLIRRLKEK